MRNQNIYQINIHRLKNIKLIQKRINMISVYMLAIKIKKIYKQINKFQKDINNNIKKHLLKQINILNIILLNGPQIQKNLNNLLTS